MRRTLVSGAAALALVVSSGPGLAEDAPDAQAATKAQTEATKAETDRLKAQTDLVKAQSDALGLTKFDGTTELKDNAGLMESWILSAGTIDAAAAGIAEEVGVYAKNRFVLVVGKDETWNFSLSSSLKEEMASLTRSLISVRGAENCQAPPPTKASAGAQVLRAAPAAAAPAPQIAGSVLPLAGAVLSALKGNTTISGVSLSPGSQLLNDAVAGKLSNGPDRAYAITPSELTDAGDIARSDVSRAWNALVQARQSLLTCRSALAVNGVQDSIKGRVAVLDSAIASADAFAARATLSVDDKPSLLVRAMLIDVLASRNPLVLRLGIEQAGGSILKRDSLASALGFSGVRLTGGLVVSYRLSEPTTGIVFAGGVMVCRTTYASMKEIQLGRTPPADCGPTVGRKPVADRW